MARKRGRPKGSTNRRAKDLSGFIGARYGASAAQQSAALCMVTPAELKAAGGSMAQALVGKAADLVERVREAQAERDDGLRSLVRRELADLAETIEDYSTAGQLRAAVNKAIDRISEAGSGFGLVQALKLMADERAQLLPYTDQRQPLAVDLTAKGGLAPSVVLMGAAPVVSMGAVEKVEDFEGVFTEVSPPKSHGEGQAVEQLQLLGPAPTD